MKDGRLVGMQDRAVRTRRAILEAAGAVFDKCGYESANLNEIVSLAEVSKGALYFHFRNKEDLALAVMHAQLSGVQPRPQMSRMQEFVDIGLLFAYRLPRDPLMRGSVRLTFDYAGRELSQGSPYLSWIERNVDILSRAKAGGELLPHVDAEAFADLVVGAYAGVNMMAQALGRRGALEARASDLYRHLLPAVVVPAVLASLDLEPGRGEKVQRESEDHAGRLALPQG